MKLLSHGPDVHAPLMTRGRYNSKYQVLISLSATITLYHTNIKTQVFFIRYCTTLYFALSFLDSEKLFISKQK